MDTRPYNYLDPGQTGGAQPSYGERWPQDTQTDLAEVLRKLAEDKANQGLDSVVSRLQGADFPYDIPSGLGSLELGDIGEAGKWLGDVPTAYDTPNFTKVGQEVTGWGSDPQEKRRLAEQMTGAMTGALSNDTGMIRMGGKEFPKAFALRTMDLSAEEPFIKRAMKQNLPNDVSSTIISPAQVGSWGDFGNQYGLLFDVNDPQAIKAMSPTDLFAAYNWLDKAIKSRKELAAINPSHSEALNFTPHKLPQQIGESTSKFGWSSQIDKRANLDLDQWIKDADSLYNEAVLSLGKDTPVSGVRIVPKRSTFYDPNKELEAVTLARSLNVPIFNLPGNDQMRDFFGRLAETTSKAGTTGGRWTKAKGQYSQGVTDTELRSNLWKDLYE